MTTHIVCKIKLSVYKEEYYTEESITLTYDMVKTLWSLHGSFRKNKKLSNEEVIYWG